MKKLSMLFAAAVAAISILSCSKEEANKDTAKSNPKVEITVADLDGASTKAVKSGWEAGDIINIWFDFGPEKYKLSGDSCDEFYPELVMTYDGLGWDCSFAAHFDKSKLQEKGVIKAVFECTNDIKDTFRYAFKEPGSEDIYCRFNPPIAAYHQYMTPMMVAARVEYTYDSVQDKVAANLTGWEFLTRIKVLVEGLTNHKSFYKLTTVKYDDGCAFLSSIKGFQLAPQDPDFKYEVSSQYGTGGGRTTDEGVEFYFYDTDSAGKSADYHFMLGVYYPDMRCFLDYVYSVKGKTLNTSGDKLMTIRIDKTKFSYYGD